MAAVKHDKMYLNLIRLSENDFPALYHLISPSECNYIFLKYNYAFVSSHCTCIL